MLRLRSRVNCAATGLAAIRRREYTEPR